MNTPDHLRYTKSHEWVLFADDGTAKVGLTSTPRMLWGIWSSSTCPRWGTP